MNASLVTVSMVRRRAALPRLGALIASMLVGLALMPPAASAAPTPVSSCQTLAAPGAYELTADLATVDATCIEITASDVKLDLAGHTLSCTGSGFAGSCQVPEVGAHGVSVAQNVAGVVVNGPGTISGFDNGVLIVGSDARVQGLTVTGPACDPNDCSRPMSNGIGAVGRLNADGSTGIGPVGVTFVGNHVSNHARGLALVGAQCPGGDRGCVVSGNKAEGNSGAACVGIVLNQTAGYTLTRNVAHFNGAVSCPLGRGIGLTAGSTDNVVTSNDASFNTRIGIHSSGGTNGNVIVNNIARDNTDADLQAEFDTADFWNDNNRCIFEAGAVPETVCNPGE